MKKKILVLIVMVVASSLLLTGCFFGSDSSGSDSGNDFEERTLRADFSMEDSSGQLYLDASSTTVEGYSNPEYAWKVNGTSYNGKKIDMTAPNSSTDIKLVVKAHKDDDTVTDSITKTYNSDSTDGDVDFSHNRTGTREYEFVGSEPSGAKYWEWKMPEESYWHGYEDENVFTYKFSSDGSKKVKLRILDENEQIIGETEKTIDVY